MHPNPLRFLMLAATLGLAAPILPAAAQTAPAVASTPGATLLNVSVQAEASQAPDVAMLSVGVTTQAADGNAAMRRNAERATRLAAAIRSAGIAERDIQTQGIQLSPQYLYSEGQPARLTGYQASNTLTLKVRDLGKLGQVLDRLAAEGADQITGPTLQIDQPGPVHDRARLAALEQAQARARLYAKSLNLQVRRIVGISESAAGGGMPMPMLSMAKAERAGTPVAAGENTVSVSLDVVFELAR